MCSNRKADYSVVRLQPMTTRNGHLNQLSPYAVLNMPRRNTVITCLMSSTKAAGSIILSVSAAFVVSSAHAPGSRRMRSPSGRHRSQGRMVDVVICFSVTAVRMRGPGRQSHNRRAENRWENHRLRYRNTFGTRVQQWYIKRKTRPQPWSSGMARNVASQVTVQ